MLKSNAKISSSHRIKEIRKKDEHKNDQFLCPNKLLSQAKPLQSSISRANCQVKSDS